MGVCVPTGAGNFLPSSDIWLDSVTRRRVGRWISMGELIGVRYAQGTMSKLRYEISNAATSLSRCRF